MNAFQVHRNSLAWILAAQVAVIAPHVMRLPVWTTAICAFCIFWRVMVYQGRWSYPGVIVKLTFVVASVAGLGFGYGTFLGVDPWVGLFIVMFSLKLLEMRGRRDAFVVVLLGYFVALTLFLYQTGIPWTLYALVACTMITAGLIGLNQTRSHVDPWYTFRKAAGLLAQSVPLMLILFVLFPRLPPLWNVPLQRNIGKTGVTDQMRPGDIAQLTQSDELAFRATFLDGDVPLNNRLYWRGIVLSYFNGDTETWTQEQARFYGRVMQKGEAPVGWESQLEYVGEPVTYAIMLEPTNQNWLFSLDLPEAIENDKVGLVRDYRFYSYDLIRSKQRYEVTSYLDWRGDVELSDFWRYRYTVIPRDVNPRAQALASDLRSASSSNRDYIQRVLNRYREEEFIYTLKPEPLGSDGIDQFLLETRSGFCSHYAGSFVYLMRAVGIPARVVVGYQGGEYNRIGNYVEVRQYDAHAWAEVWLAGEGWVRVDPTSAVAPERIRSGLEEAVSGEETFLADVGLSWMKFRHNLLITEIRLQLSALSHYWDTFVVGYTPEMQMSFLGEFVEDIDYKDLGIMMLAAFFGTLGLIGLVLLSRRSFATLSANDQAFLKFCEIMAKRGLPRQQGEAPYDYANRIAEEQSEVAEAARAVIDRYVALTYVDDTPEEASALEQEVRRFRLQAMRA